MYDFLCNKNNTHFRIKTIKNYICNIAIHSKTNYAALLCMNRIAKLKY